MTTKFYLDRRSSREGSPCPLKISISSKGSTAYVPTGVSLLPEQWDARAQKVVSHPQKSQLNNLLSRKKLDVDSALYDLLEEGRLLGRSVTEIRDVLLERLNPVDNALVLPRMEAYTSRQTKDKTKGLYRSTTAKIRAFSGKGADSLHFNDITPQWLERFDGWMAANGLPKRNARNVHLRNLRSVFNEAIDDGLTDNYPFRKFKIRPEPTKSRALSVEQLHTLFNTDLGRHQHYLDIFLLSFCLGGLSFCDLIALKKTDVVRGRIEFRRQKTGQLVSVGIQPEAQSLIDKYKGRERLIDIAERYSDTDGYLSRMRKHLRHVGQTYNPSAKRWEGEPLAPDISQYWARYSLATIAAEAGFSEDSVASVLGHHTNSVTSTYIRANRNSQVDAVVRGVLDIVLKGTKKGG